MNLDLPKLEGCLTIRLTRLSAKFRGFSLDFLADLGMMFGSLGMEGSNSRALKAGSSGTVKLFILGNQTKLSCAMHKFSMFTVGGGPTEKEKELLPDVCQRWAKG